MGVAEIAVAAWSEGREERGQRSEQSGTSQEAKSFWPRWSETKSLSWTGWPRKTSSLK